MIFDMFGGKKQREEEREKEREKERAWALYGKEVEAFLNNDKMDREFEQLEKSKAVSRPELKLNVSREKEAPLPVDLALRVKRGEAQESKVRRFMTDPELQALLYGAGKKPEAPEAASPEKSPPTLSPDLKQRVALGEIQRSKAHRFMTDRELQALLYGARKKPEAPAAPEKSSPALSPDLKQRVALGEIQRSKAHRFMTDRELQALLYGGRRG